MGAPRASRSGGAAVGVEHGLAAGGGAACCCCLRMSGAGGQAGGPATVKLLRLEEARGSTGGPAAAALALQSAARRGRLLLGVGCPSCGAPAAVWATGLEGSSPSSPSSSGCCSCTCSMGKAGALGAAAAALECARFLPGSCSACCCCCCVAGGSTHAAVPGPASGVLPCWGHTTNRLDTRRASWGRQRACQPRSHSMHCKQGHIAGEDRE